ncbi:MAG: PilZ domain-containing protein [Myxococcota bacterium]|nr:PilZ domain-containing protein [Myxococcota bacterium]MDW8361587.1 PilZ domain-containing protein [Myxococcales bacterium]
MAGETRRAHERFDCSLDVVLRLEDGRELHGRSRNVSLGGMRLELGQSVPYGTTGTLRVRLPALKEPAELPCTVRWCAQGDVGVQFGSLRPIEVWAINQIARGA